MNRYKFIGYLIGLFISTTFWIALILLIVKNAR